MRLNETNDRPLAVATAFGKRTKTRIAEIDQILETLQNLEKL